MCPAGWPNLIMTYVLIIVPSFPVLVWTCYGIGGWAGSVFLGIPYFLSAFNTIRLVMKVALTDPGILPKLKSSQINYNKTHSVMYRKAEELSWDNTKSSGSNFFTLK